jgi:hypothetical protein
MKKIKFLYTITVLLLGCTAQTKTGDEILTVHLDFTRQPENIHEIGLIDNVRILSLDCEEAIFGEVNKIIRYEDHIYLMDKSQTRSVVVYDISGHFVNLISKQGKGPEEYIQLTDIFIDPDDNTLNVVSRVDKKILKYDITGNRLLEVKKTPKPFTRFSKMKDGYVGYMGNYGEDGKMPYKIWTMSPDMKPENHFFDLGKHRIRRRVGIFRIQWEYEFHYSDGL